MIIQTDPTNTNDPDIGWPLRLSASVLRRAMVDWVLYRDHADHRLAKFGDDAGSWIFGEARVDNINSFQSVCGTLNLDPELVQEKIKGMTEERVRRLRGMEFGDES